MSLYSASFSVSLADTMQAAVVAIIALTITLLLHRLLIAACLRWKILDRPGLHKRHSLPTPNLGGVSLFLGLVVTIIIVKVIYPGIFLADELPWIHVCLGALVTLTVGVIDDIRPVRPTIKLLAQALAGMILVSGGIAPDPLHIPFVGEVSTGAWGGAVTVLWVIALTNAINLIDGLDGLATGVSLIAACALAVIASALGVTAVAIICVSIAGGLVATLYYNIYPARLFLGDSGALLIGYLFATLSLVVPIKSYTTAALFPPLVALAVPLIEAFVSFTRRIVTGRSFMAADRRHLFHHLGYMGLGPRATVWVFWLVGLFCAASSVSMLFLDKSLVLAVVAGALVVVFLIFLIFRFRKTHGAHNSESIGSLCEDERSENR